ncbi:hypothetical protein [Bacillus sp. MMSF_3328]|uniref:hypothetical protein n=1 Tax=Bacillus sp. MMSF_3328 TaxID=3047080 RepID=UPI00273D2CAE|nr:hypothetical protein [Bacillus sp. MMSF_3328]
MLRLKNSNDLVNALSLLIDKTQHKKERKRDDYILNNMDTTFKLGQIDPAYSSGRPRIIFEGETATSVKAYPYLSSYTPVAGDVVLLARVGNSYIVLGKRI